MSSRKKSECATNLEVCLVDDSDTNIVVAEAYLKRLGHQVTVAKDGRSALEAFQTAVFDVILMDIQMPILDGYEATRKIRDSNGGADLPIIGVSAGGANVSREKALEAGMSEFFAKPVDWDALEDTMQGLSTARKAQNGQSE